MSEWTFSLRFVMRGPLCSFGTGLWVGLALAHTSQNEASLDISRYSPVMCPSLTNFLAAVGDI